MTAVNSEVIKTPVQIVLFRPAVLKRQEKLVIHTHQKVKWLEEKD